MPHVPDYGGSPQVQNEGFPSGIVRADSSGSSGLAQGLSNAREIFSAVAQQEAARADHIAVQAAENQLSNWSNTRLFDPTNGAFAKKGKDAFGLSTTVLPEYDAASKEIDSSLTNERQKRAFDQIRQAQRLSMYESLNRHEAGERNSYYDEETVSTISDSVKSAGNFFNDPRQIRYQIARQERALTAQAERNGWSKEQLDASLRSAESKTHLEVLDRMLALRQSGPARMYLNRVRDSMLGDDVTTVERALQTDDATTRTQLRDQLADLEAAARVGKATHAPSQQELVSAYGDYEGNRLHKEAQNLLSMSNDINQISGLPRDKLIELVGSYEPQTQEGAASAAERSAFMDGSIKEILNQREKDPGSYLVANSPQVQAAWQALSDGEDGAGDQFMQVAEAEAERLQIQNKNLLPDAYTDQLVADIVKPKDNETLYASISSERDRWGKQWDKVYSQIAPKLPDSAAVIGSGISPQAGIALSSMSSLKSNELKALVPPGREWGDIADSVRDKFKDLIRSFPPDSGGTRTAEAVVDSGVRLALFHMKSGSNMDSAIKLAYKQLGTDMYAITEFRGVPFRIPAGLDAGQVELGARDIVRNFRLPPEDATGTGTEFSVEEFSTMTSEYLQQNAYWVTNPEGTGLRMYVDGAPVTAPRSPQASGGTIDISWADLIYAGDQFSIKTKKLNEELQRTQPKF